MELLRQLRPSALAIAGLCTIAGVGLSMRWGPQQPIAWMLLGAFALAFLVHEGVAKRAPRAGYVVLAAQPLIALALLMLMPRFGTAQVLLVVWTAVAASVLPPRAVLPAVIVVDAAAYLILRRHGHDSALVVTLLYAGFQGFAALTAHYANTAERSRDALARVNADLLATRALLVDSARDAERLRVARELHDVAGHKLTALMLNLRVLERDPAFAGRDELHVAERMARELLGDLRDVVHALRDARGLDLATALRALAAPMPRPALDLDIAPDVRVDDPAIAEAVLRLVQEALTNAARHADADRLHVRIARHADALVVQVEDDGRLRGAVREGSGLVGMRERVVALGGDVEWSRSTSGGMRIVASLPA